MDGGGQGANSLVAFINQNGNNRLNDPENMAKELKTIARNAYRLNPKMKRLCFSGYDHPEYRVFQKSGKEAGLAYCPRTKAIPQTIDIIPGIGLVFAAAEIGDISRFDIEASLAQYAGLTWSRYQSGNLIAGAQ